MAGAISDWSAEFEDPIELPNGRKLIMLRSAGYRPVLTPCGLIDFGSGLIWIVRSL